MNLIFLDIDGVLNTHEPLEEGVMCGKLHDKKVERLNTIIDSTGAKIVLSSAWRYLVHRGEMNLAGLGWLLRSHGIRDVLIGVTRPDTMERGTWDGSTHWTPCNNERGQQISDWIKDHNNLEADLIERYVVIDDLDLGITDSGLPFVKCDPAQGLTFANAMKAFDLLRNRTDE